MFPQYCGATSGAVFDQVTAALGASRHVPSLTFVSDYHDDAAYIDALAASVEDHRRTHGTAEHLLMSLPPRAEWRYDYSPPPGSAEARLSDYLKPRDWLA
jgi:protoheme ferro-lyase